MDDDLARRLAALRHSLETPTPPQAPPQDPISEKELASSETGDDDLSARFQRLTTLPLLSSHSSKPLFDEKNAEVNRQEEPSIDELLSALSTEISSNPMCTQEEEEKEEAVLALLKDANLIPPATPDHKPAWDFYSNVPRKDAEGETEDDILRRVRDEIEYEKAHGIGQEEEDELSSAEKESEGGEIDTSLLSRFQALEAPSLPSVPKLEPAAGRVGWSEAKEHKLVDETDTWCCICNEDAEYRCSGCENDIYCAACLYQFHTGPDSGYEERRHKWTKYTKPKKLALA
ncbi:hypothetical protein RUND412_004482 [Rhizina undulata]